MSGCIKTIWLLCNTLLKTIMKLFFERGLNECNWIIFTGEIILLYDFFSIKFSVFVRKKMKSACENFFQTVPYERTTVNKSSFIQIFSLTWFYFCTKRIVRVHVIYLAIFVIRTKKYNKNRKGEKSL